MTAPPRIVSLAPTQTEIIAALGLLENLEGVTENCDYPPAVASLPKFGSWHSPDLGRTIRCNPDVACTFGKHQEEFRDTLEESGIKTCHGDPPTIEAARGCIREMAALFGRPERGERLIAGLVRRLERIRERIESAPSRHVPAVLRIMNWEPFITVGPGAFQHDVIEFAGGRNVFADGPAPYFVRDPAQARARDPEVIFFCEPAILTLLERDPEWKKVSAVKNGRVHVFDCGLTCRSGPRIVDMAEQLNGVLMGRRGKEQE